MAADVESEGEGFVAGADQDDVAQQLLDLGEGGVIGQLAAVDRQPSLTQDPCQIRGLARGLELEGAGAQAPQVAQPQEHAGAQGVAVEIDGVGQRIGGDIRGDLALQQTLRGGDLQLVESKVAGFEGELTDHFLDHTLI